MTGPPTSDARAVGATPQDGLSAEAVRELREIHARQVEVLRDTLEARAALEAIRASASWRLIEAARRLRLRLRGPAMRARGLRRLVRVGRHRRGVAASVREAPLGVNVAGYLNTESGMGEAARLSILSLQSAGVPVALNNVESKLRKLDTTYQEYTSANPHPFNLVHLNADNMEWFARGRGRRYFRGKYTIGYWFWELSGFRDDWMPAFGCVDEVWTATEFVRAAIAARSRLPVACMPLPIVPPAPHETVSATRQRLGLASDTFVFLFTFDVSSQMERKNPFGVIGAFRRAFGAGREAALVLKFTNGEYDRLAVRRLHDAAAGLNARLLDGYMDRGELASLMTASDCYVSLHRSEGFGLTIAEAMSLGKPAIATGYSGNIDFMTAENSYLVSYRIVPITRDYGPYMIGFSWAEPDLEHAASLMLEVARNPDAAAAKARRAVADLQGSRTPRHTGARMRRRLEDLQKGQREISPK